MENKTFLDSTLLNDHTNLIYHLDSSKCSLKWTFQRHFDAFCQNLTSDVTFWTLLKMHPNLSSLVRIIFFTTYELQNPDNVSY